MNEMNEMNTMKTSNKEQKAKYESPEVEIIAFDDADMITMSTGDSSNDNDISW